MEGSLLRLKSFIPRREKLPFEYGQISMFDYATFQKYPLDLATGTLNGISRHFDHVGPTGGLRKLAAFLKVPVARSPKVPKVGF